MRAIAVHPKPWPLVFTLRPLLDVDIAIYPSTEHPGEWKTNIVHFAPDVENPKETTVVGTSVVRMRPPKNMKEAARWAHEIAMAHLQHEALEFLRFKSGPESTLVRCFDPHNPRKARELPEYPTVSWKRPVFGMNTKTGKGLKDAAPSSKGKKAKRGSEDREARTRSRVGGASRGVRKSR